MIRPAAPEMPRVSPSFPRLPLIKHVLLRAIVGWQEPEAPRLRIWSVLLSMPSSSGDVVPVCACKAISALLSILLILVLEVVLIILCRSRLTAQQVMPASLVFFLSGRSPLLASFKAAAEIAYMESMQRDDMEGGRSHAAAT